VYLILVDFRLVKCVDIGFEVNLCAVLGGARRYGEAGNAVAGRFVFRSQQADIVFVNESAVSQLHKRKQREVIAMNDVNSLAHTKWNCKYHIVFAPKYRRKVFYGEKRLEIGEILRTLCNWKKIRIVEAEVCPDHVHMLVEIPPKFSVSSFMGYLKGKSSLMIYEKYPELRYKYRNREFWCRGYYVDTAGKNAKKIEEYIRHQLEEDKAGEQLTMGNF